MAKDYINIDLPPGIRSNGTEYSNRGSWVDGSRIRWANGTIRPIGGWSRMTVDGGFLPPLYSDPSSEVARSLAVWKTNAGSSLYAAGTNLKLYAWDERRMSIADITPTTFEPRETMQQAKTGYGMWYFGTGAYGVEQDVSGGDDSELAFSWHLRNWGQNLLAAPQGAPSMLYEWNTVFSDRATPVAGAPENFDCFHVTSQRIVMVAGDPTDPRIIKWSDSEDHTDWTPRANNKAGFQQLPGVGRFREIVTLRDSYILVSETDAYVARYIGGSFVFGFEQLGDDCGTPSPKAVVATNEFVIWPGYTSFFISDGSRVQRIQCDVLDKFSNTLNRAHASKTYGFVNPFWPEVWWLYQEGDTDLDSYIYYNWESQHWGYGKLNRTAAGGYSTFGGLIMVARDGTVYRHELTGTLPIEDNPSEIYVTSGPIELARGNQMQYVKSMLPDFLTVGQVAISIIGRDRPTAPEVSFGPYLIDYPAKTNQPVPVRARGATVKLHVEGSRNAWELGSLRLDFKLGGER